MPVSGYGRNPTYLVKSFLGFSPHCPPIGVCLFGPEYRFDFHVCLSDLDLVNLNCSFCVSDFIFTCLLVSSKIPNLVLIRPSFSSCFDLLLLIDL